MVTFGQDGGVIVGGVAARALLDGGQLQLRECDRETVSSGLRGVDSLLPFGGVRRGSLIEFLAGGVEDSGPPAEAGGAAALACAVASRLADGRRGARTTTIIIVDRPGWFHPPAVLPWCPASRLVVARPAHDDDEIWTIDQALACPDVAAVVAWPRTPAGATWDAPQTRRVPRRPAHSRWSVAMRRWQLSARSGGAVGMFVLPASVRRDPSWAEARIAVTPQGDGPLPERRLRLERVGGAWHGVGGRHEPPRVVDVVLDLARGCEAASRVVPRRPLPWEAVDGAVTCRAS